jgi:ketosteroid isomerase-like protein
MTTSDTSTAKPTSVPDTAETIGLFNDAFQRRDKNELAALVHQDCLMVSAQPAPDGIAYVGKEACVAFWAELMDDESTTFEVQHVFAAGDWAAVRWRYRFGLTDAESVLGVNVTRVSGGRVIEQLGYTKAPGGLPLPE